MAKLTDGHRAKLSHYVVDGRNRLSTPFPAEAVEVLTTESGEPLTTENGQDLTEE